MITLREFVEAASVTAEAIFAESGTIRPMYQIVLGAEEHVVVAAPRLPKDQSVAAMRAIFTAVEATRYLFVNEAWTVATDKATDDGVQAFVEQGGSLEHWNGRREVVMFLAEDDAEGLLQAEREIIREDGAPPKLGPLRFLESGGVVSGRMVGLLPHKGALQ